MSEPEVVESWAEAPKPWPLHETVVKSLKGFSPFGLIFAWGIVGPSVVIALRAIAPASASPGACAGFVDLDCMASPITAAYWITLFGILPVLTGFLVLTLLLSLVRVPLRYRLWFAGVGPPLTFLLFGFV